MMTYAQPGTQEHARLTSWYPRVGVVGGGQSRLAVHPCMPYHRLADRLPGADVCVAALEFGTDNASRIDLDLIREENYIHMRGDPFCPEGRLVRARMRKRFTWSIRNGGVRSPHRGSTLSTARSRLYRPATMLCGQLDRSTTPHLASLTAHGFTLLSGTPPEAASRAIPA
jgi:hypothetical protein